LIKKQSELSGFQHNLSRLGPLDFALHLQLEIRVDLRDTLSVRDQSQRASSHSAAISMLKKGKELF
jgi:hypothetical protein